MKTKSAFLFAAALLVAAIARGDEPTAPKPSGMDELKNVMDKVSAKLKAGTRDEAGLADELKALDAIAVARKDETTEIAPQALYLEAQIRLQTFEDYDGGATLLARLVKEFPKSQLADNAARMVRLIAEHQESAKVAAALKPGTPFPDFSEKDLAGEPLSLAQFKGKVVLLDFWATWCGPCVGELPNVLAAYGKYHDKGFEIVGISLDEDDGKLQGFIGAKGMTWRQYFDGQGWGNKLAKRYGVTAIPATYLLDRDGKIVAKDLRGPALAAKLGQMLGE